jgi:hypothetical protein
MKPKPVSHVTALKQKVIERIKAKSGKAQGHSTTSSAGSDLPVPDVPPAGWIRNPEYDKLGPSADVKFVFHPKVLQVVKAPVENHGSVNDLARSVIFSRVKQPVSTDLSKSQLHSSKGHEAERQGKATSQDSGTGPE